MVIVVLHAGFQSPTTEGSRPSMVRSSETTDTQSGSHLPAALHAKENWQQIHVDHGGVRDVPQQCLYLFPTECIPGGCRCANWSDGRTRLHHRELLPGHRPGDEACRNSWQTGLDRWNCSTVLHRASSAMSREKDKNPKLSMLQKWRRLPTRTIRVGSRSVISSQLSCPEAFLTVCAQAD